MKYLFAFCLCFFIQQSWAEDSPISLPNDFYVVEMLIFTNDLAMYQNEENWPQSAQLSLDTPLTYLKNVPVASVYPELVTFFPQAPATTPTAPTPSSDDNEAALPLLGDSFLQLNNAANKIQRAGRHTLVFHQAWLEKFVDKDQAANIVIEAGAQQQGFYAISGTIKLFLSRYLHIQTNLWRVDFAAEGSDSQGVDVQLPLLHKAAPEQNADTVLDSLLQSQTLQQPIVQRITLMQQQRRMRSNEAHFLDNPLFGVIIQIRPLDVASLSTAQTTAP